MECAGGRAINQSQAVEIIILVCFQNRAVILVSCNAVQLNSNKVKKYTMMVNLQCEQIRKTKKQVWGSFLHMMSKASVADIHITNPKIGTCKSHYQYSHTDFYQIFLEKISAICLSCFEALPPALCLHWYHQLLLLLLHFFFLTTCHIKLSSVLCGCLVITYTKVYRKCITEQVTTNGGHARHRACVQLIRLNVQERQMSS